MTHEQFITLETSQLAKQAGFDWDVNHFYGRTGKQWCFFTSDSDINYNDTEEYLCDAINDWCSTPTQAVLQRWLREVKNYDIVVRHVMGNTPNDVYKEYEFEINHMYRKAMDGVVVLPIVGSFETYEDCLEMAIESCLNLILNNK